MTYYYLTWDQAFIFFIFLLFSFFGSRGKKNSGWYIHLTSHQLPPNLHNVTSAWPVMLLANQRLRHGNQILAGIMSLSKSILGKRKFLSTFLKKNLNVFFFFFLWWNTASWSCRNFYWLCPVPKAAKKKIRLKHHISRTEKRCESEDRSE